MKKFLKISGKILVIIIVLFVLALFIVPVAFKGKLMEIARIELNNSVNAHVEFSDFNLSLIRSFPNLNISLEGLCVSGKDAFEGDTLVTFRSFQVSVNPFSVLGNKGIMIRKILLDRPVIHVLVLKNGLANWDIAPENEESDTLVVTPEDITSGSVPSVKIQLKKFEIRKAFIIYDDRQGKMQATLDDLNFLLKGKWSGSSGSLFTETTIVAINVLMGKVRYVKDATFRFTATLGADMKRNVFIFRQNELALNDLLLGLEGKVAISGDAIDVDAVFNTRETSFKSLLSLVPAIYTNDFKDLQTKGALVLSGYVKGRYLASDSIYPSAGLTLKVADASFAYPGLPESVNDVNMDVKILADGTNPDLSTVDVNRFALKIGQNPFHAAFHIKHPVSDPEIKGAINGKIDLATLSEAVPLDNTEISGLITTNLRIGGKISMIEKKNPEQFTADGSVQFKGLEVSTPMMADHVEIPEGTLLFSPRYVDLQKLKIVIGSSDMVFSGKVEDFIPYLFHNGVVTGRLDFTSKNMDINRLMPSAGEDTIAQDTVPTELAVVEIPERIDLAFHARMGKVKYGNLEARNVEGDILVKDRKMILENISLDAMGGKVKMKGEYATDRPEEPRVALTIDMQNIEIPEAYKSLVTVRKLAPFASGLHGSVSSKLTYSGTLDQHMMPVLNTVNGYGKLQSDEVAVLSAGVFEKIKGLLKMNPQYTNTFKDLNISFSIENGVIHVKPFHAKAGNIFMTISGEQGLDQSIQYIYKIKMPRKDMGAAADKMISGLYQKAAQQGLNIQPSETITLIALITGTVTNPKVKLDLANQLKSGVETVKEAVKKKVEKVVQEKVQQVQEKVNQEKEQLKKEAGEKADRFLAEAKKTYEETLQKAKEERDNIYKKADKIEKEASGTIMQKLQAKAQAKALRKGADIAYEKVVILAKEQYQKAVKKAGEIRNSRKDF